MILELERGRLTTRWASPILQCMSRRIGLLFFALLCALCAPGRPDTVVFKSGKRIEGVVVSRNDAGVVVINPFRSRSPDMTWGIAAKNRIPAAKVAEVIVADPPRVEYRRRASRPGLKAEDHLELARFCKSHKLRHERERELQLTLCADPQNAEALAALGESKWKAWAKGNPIADRKLRELEHAYVQIEDASKLAAKWKEMQKLGTRRKLAYLERARRSAALPKGRRDKVPVTLRGRELEGATYCIYVSKSYDPLKPTALVLGLHGGGPGGKNRNLVTGSGESAMNFYGALTEGWGWICVCPSALRAGWSAKRNAALLEAVIDEMKMLYNIDENRIYLIGHSMGGFGTWYWGPQRADLWAACAPCAGAGGPNGIATKGLPIYIYHGTDDPIVGVGSDRNAAKALLASRKRVDFVYTELDKIGHGFPAWVRTDIFRFFAGRWKDKGRKHAVAPRSSFVRKVSREEVKAFGDPAKLPAGPEDETIRHLVAALAKGGGGAAKAAKELESHKDEATVKAVAKVLRSKRNPVDARVYAAEVLGEIALPACVKPLGKAATAEDFRIVEAVAQGLGRTGVPEAAPYLVKAAKRLGAIYAGSFFGDVINFTEYNVRLKSFTLLVGAFEAVGVADAALPVLASQVVGPVFAPKKPYRVAGENDPRFKQIPPGARMRLAHALRTCLVKLHDPRGAPLLQSIADHWAKEPRLVREAEMGIEELKQ